MRAYAAIIDAVVGVVGTGAACGLLYYLGKRIGRGLAEELGRRMKGSTGGLEEFAARYAEYLQELGFGRVEVREADEASAAVRIEGAPSVEGAKLLGGEGEVYHRCCIEAGMIAAAFEDYLGGRYYARGCLEEDGSCTLLVRSCG